MKTKMNYLKEIGGNKMVTAIKDEALEKVTGGSLYLGGVPFRVCKHDHKNRTGGERADSRWIWWSQHQFQYFCPECKKMFWEDED